MPPGEELAPGSSLSDHSCVQNQVNTLATARRPLTIPEILAAAPQLPQSTAYRNLTALIEAGIDLLGLCPDCRTA